MVHRRIRTPRSTLAYFSAEYAFHHSLPLYAGGLGVLAGDYIKECSDLAIPMVGRRSDLFARLSFAENPRRWLAGRRRKNARSHRTIRRDWSATPGWRASESAGSLLRSAGSRSGVARGHWPSAGLFTRYGSREQPALGSRDRASALYERRRAAFTTGDCAGHRRYACPGDGWGLSRGRAHQ